MIRILTLAAAAAAILAAPASAESIRVPTAGKSTEQIRADVYAAARKVCSSNIASPLPMEAYSACRKHAVATAMAQLNTTTAAANTSTTVAGR